MEKGMMLQAKGGTTDCNRDKDKDPKKRTHRQQGQGGSLVEFVTL